MSMLVYDIVVIIVGGYVGGIEARVGLAERVVPRCYQPWPIWPWPIWPWPIWPWPVWPAHLALAHLAGPFGPGPFGRARLALARAHFPFGTNSKNCMHGLCLSLSLSL